MILSLAWRLLVEPSPRAVAKFLYNFLWKGGRAVARFQLRRRHGEIFPAFMFISITSRCNLCCQGCWAAPDEPPLDMPLDQMDRIVSECEEEGIHFFGILGGEPLLHPELFKLVERHGASYFLIFTNGTVLTEQHAAAMQRLGNVSPLISIEGGEQTGDERRGGKNVYMRSMRAVELCRRARLIVGVATSVCRSNFDEMVKAEFLTDLVRRGVHYMWYYIYRPAGPRPAPDLALSQEQIVALRRFMVAMRPKIPLLLVDSYWDHEGRALCPAAAGISYHINPAGHVEPCPVIQFATERVGRDGPVGFTVRSSRFLAAFRELATRCTRGCLFMEHPALLGRLVLELGASDTTGRGTAKAELAAAKPLCSHHVPGEEIPEQHWLYRLAKKRWLFGLGAYG